jgi:hypothetical protein
MIRVNRARAPVIIRQRSPPKSNGTSQSASINTANDSKVPFVPKKDKTSSPLFVQAPQENEFVLVDGKRLKNLLDLVDAFDSIGDGVFNHHVTVDRNDFAYWIDDTLQEHELAANLRQIKSKLETRNVIQKMIIDRYRGNA